jgi:hypothetical protein
MLIPDTTARVGGWYPDNTLIRVDLPDPFWSEEGTSVGWIDGGLTLDGAPCA